MKFGVQNIYQPSGARGQSYLSRRRLRDPVMEVMKDGSGRQYGGYGNGGYGGFVECCEGGVRKC